eukprot:m.4869 g.4869  ORF g.4869 m.4869 type:complete len:167 (-) comp4042_c0_seq1:88-588(-)
MEDNKDALMAQALSFGFEYMDVQTAIEKGCSTMNGIIDWISRKDATTPPSLKLTSKKRNATPHTQRSPQPLSNQSMPPSHPVTSRFAEKQREEKWDFEKRQADKRKMEVLAEKKRKKKVVIALEFICDYEDECISEGYNVFIFQKKVVRITLHLGASIGFGATCCG